MKHYKKPDNSIWAFELDGSQDHLITDDMTPINDADLAAWREAQLPEIDPKDAIRTEIATLEASITQRRLRDAVLTGDKSFIERVDAEISRLRVKL